MRRKLLTLTAATALLASTALAGGLGDMTDDERAAFRAEVRQYLLDNPQVLMEAMSSNSSTTAAGTAARRMKRSRA